MRASEVLFRGKPRSRWSLGDLVEYYHREISVANSSGPLWQPVTNVSGGATLRGGFVFPKNQQTGITYDADGNLTFDGVWNYKWDGENRLISMNMTNVAGIASTNRLKLDFVYDYLGRRVGKIVSTNSTGSTFVAQSTNRYVYDGWNLVAVLNPQSSVIQSFLWGSDLSGTMTGAGGVGGLLMASVSGANCFPAYDGNGNITALINAGDKSSSARYEFNPFGELIRETGPQAHQNPFRFSTRFWDDESGLVYFGYRYYIPPMGRWASRDCVQESGGLQLYQFANNSPIHTFDPNGNTPLQLTWLGYVGMTANIADFLFNMSSYSSPPGRYDFGRTGNWMQGVAVALSIEIDTALGGRLLKNIGGPIVFDSYFAGGLAAGYAKVLGHQQSLAAAVVSGRLAAIGAIGQAATAQAAGVSANGDELESTANAFLLSARRGDMDSADLNAAMIGEAIYREQALDPVNVSALLFDMVNRDAASAFSRLAEYQALNAWDTARAWKTLLRVCDMPWTIHSRTIRTLGNVNLIIASIVTGTYFLYAISSRVEVDHTFLGVGVAKLARGLSVSIPPWAFVLPVELGIVIAYVRMTICGNDMKRHKELCALVGAVGLYMVVMRAVLHSFTPLTSLVDCALGGYVWCSHIGYFLVGRNG